MRASSGLKTTQEVEWAPTKKDRLDHLNDYCGYGLIGPLIMYLNGHFYGESPQSKFGLRMAIAEAFVNAFAIQGNRSVT